jgi:hypothetical protein
VAPEHGAEVGTAEDRDTSGVSLALMTDDPFPGPSHIAKATATVSPASIRRARRR